MAALLGVTLIVAVVALPRTEMFGRVLSSPWIAAAEAWSQAVKASNIPERDLALSAPLLLYSASSAFSSSRTAPSSSGVGVGVGVGGGGGGGSSGAW